MNLEESDVQFDNGVKITTLVNAGSNKEDILKQAKEIASKDAWMQWRLDCFENVEQINLLLELANELRKVAGETKILVTFRSQKNGGQTELGSEDAYLNLIKLLIDFKLGDAVDIELNHTQDRVDDLINSAHVQGLQVVKTTFK